jgi:putative oxidoreductase
MSSSTFTRRLLSTPDEIGPLVGRLLLGIVMFPHGAQKLLGWFGGYGFTGTMGYFTDVMSIPWIFGFLAIVAEFFGSLALIVGFVTRVSALGIGIVMIVATLTSHLQHGFFMDWGGKLAGEGFEYHILALALSLVLILKGGGTLSVDRAIAKA